MRWIHVLIGLFGENAFSFQHGLKGEFTESCKSGRELLGAPSNIAGAPNNFLKTQKCPCTFSFYKNLFFFHSSFLLSLSCVSSIPVRVFSILVRFLRSGACALLWCDICQLRYVAGFVWLIVYFW